MPKKQRIIIIAGPNGAGKTTFAREYLLKEAHCPDFVNASHDTDVIESRVWPLRSPRSFGSRVRCKMESSHLRSTSNSLSSH